MPHPAMLELTTTIPNFDRLFYNKLRCSAKLGSTILVEGAAGSGKTSLSMQLACNFVRTQDGCVLREAGGRMSRLWSNAKRLSVYIHLEDDPERLDNKIDTYCLLGEEERIKRDFEEIGDIHKNDRLIAFVSGDELDKKRREWRDRYAKKPKLENPLPFEPQRRAEMACEHEIEPECDYDLVSILVTDIFNEIAGAGPVLFLLVVDNLNSLDTFDITDTNAKWTVRHKYAYLRSYIQRYAAKLSKRPDTKILPLLCVFVADEPRAEDRSPRNQVEYVSDAYIRLGSEDIGPHRYSARTIEVVKASNLAHVRGKQYFAIQPGRGVNIYLSPPALLGLFRSREKKEATTLVPFNAEKATCKEIDRWLTTIGDKQGLMAHSATMVRGAVGSSRSLLALHFLDGIGENEAALYVSLSSRTDMLMKTGQRFGLKHFSESTAACVEENENYDSLNPDARVFLMHLPSSYMVTGCFFTIMEDIKRKIERREKLHLSRLVIGNLSQFAHCLPNVNEKEMFLPAFTEWLTYNKVTCLLLDSISSHREDGLSARDEMFENIFEMQNLGCPTKHSDDHRFDLSFPWVNGSRHTGNTLELVVRYQENGGASLDIYTPPPGSPSTFGPMSGR
jgi:KaiC/GvpD/RAD55 family RecA-like ATPase